MSDASTERHALLFTAPWSAGSTILAKEVREHKPALQVEEVNVESEPDRADRYLVVSIPTLVVFEKGKEKGRLLGSMSLDDIRRAVRGQESAPRSPVPGKRQGVVKGGAHA